MSEVEDQVEVEEQDPGSPQQQQRNAEELARTRTFVTTVAAVEDVHPHLRRVTFRGGDLTTFEPVGPDTFLYLLLSPPGRPDLAPDATFSWEATFAAPEEERPVGAYYTLRAWRPGVSELDFLMVLHGDSGPASAWAMRAEPGDRVALWGPRSAFHPPAGTDRLVLVADETGLPAVAAIIEHVDGDLPITVVAEVGSASERQTLPARGAVDIRWFHRDGAAAGSTTNLVDGVRALPPFEGRPYVWGGGESRGMTRVRRHVRDERGLDRDSVSLVAYWRRRLHDG